MEFLPRPEHCQPELLREINIQPIFSSLRAPLTLKDHIADMSSAREPSEADVIFNKASVALARSQRLIASWLPPRTAQELANVKSEEDLEREDREIFAPVPELYV
jgi:hypothetical protein